MPHKMSKDWGGAWAAVIGWQNFTKFNCAMGYSALAFRIEASTSPHIWEDDIMIHAVKWHRSLLAAAGVNLLLASTAMAADVTVWCWAPLVCARRRSGAPRSPVN